MSETQVLSRVENIGFATRARTFMGFPRKADLLRRRLECRGAVRFDLGPGDLLSIDGLRPDDGILALVFDTNGRSDSSLLGLSGSDGVPWADVDGDALMAWLSARGGGEAQALAAARIGGEGLLVLKASAACHVWALRPVSAMNLTSGATKPEIELTHRPVSDDAAAFLPPPLGIVRDEFTVRRGSALAYELRAGEVVQIIDMEGQQCSDFMAFRADGLERGDEKLIDSTVTRTMVRRAYPGPGLFDKFYDSDMRPLLNVVQDTCGQHDTFGVACTARGYEDRGFPGHLNCSDNISDAMATFGVRKRAAWPAINFFWRTWLDPHSHHILTEESHSRPGDYVAMRAMDDLVCVTTACPDDIDPINGWNPTDIHVRIYKAGAQITRAVAYREKENAPMEVSQESAFHPRTSDLTTHFAPARNLWAPVSYSTHGTIEEYWACRDRVTVQDMSSLRKFDIVGPDAETLLQRAITRDVSRLAVWRGTYALLCDDTGSVVDDGTLFRLGPELFRWCCGSEESGRILKSLSEEAGLQVRIMSLGGSLPNLALQGPKSREVLEKIVFTQPHVPALGQMKWFGVTVARLKDREGIPFMLSRTGYTGELGYELFCGGSDAVALWDAVMDAGAEFGIAPMGAAALETIRIEAGLAAANAEFAPGVDAFEAGLGFAVDLKKADFTGKTALARNAEAPRRLLKGLLLDCSDVPAHGAPVFMGERQVGQVTSATRSPILERAIAIARLSIEHAQDGTVLEVGQLDGRMKRLGATVAGIPFVDPQRTRARS